MGGSAKWERVAECTDGRVFLLRLTGSNRKHFFWMQEPDTEKDAQYTTNINKLCNGESLSDSADSSAAGTSGAAAGTDTTSAMAQTILAALQAQGQGQSGQQNSASANGNRQNGQND